MVNRKVISYDRLKDELNEKGRFSKNVPSAGVSHDVLQALDYLYYEIKDLCERNQFKVFGPFFEISFEKTRIYVRSFYKSGSIHVKSFLMSENDVKVYEVFLQMIPSVYSSINVFKKQTFYHERNQHSTYLIEYNDSQEEEHSQ